MYAGTLFRSRLEARWAVFFDELGIRWEFEPEGFYVGFCRCEPSDDCLDGECINRRRYLPDFLLPDLNIWVEVKGSEEHLDRDLLCAAIDYRAGLPHVGCQSYWSGSENLGGLLVLGPIPRPMTDQVPTHPLIQHHKGAVIQWIRFEVGTVIRRESYDDDLGEGISGAFYKGPLLEPNTYFDVAAPEVAAAYSAARSARFEHSHREVWSKTSH